MTPVLFPANATSFETQGLGALSNAISCTVMEERNGEFELEMQYPQSGVHFADISDRCIITAIPSPWRTAQPFRIYRITKPMNGVCTIYARHITYDLGGIPVNVFSAQSVASALAGLKSNSAAENPFEFWTDKTTTANFAVTTPAALRSRLGGNTGSVLDVYGGEYEWDGMTVKLHNNRGTDRGVTIRYGKNLTDIEQDRNIANVRTGVYPYWTNSDGALVVCDPPVVNAPGSYDFANIETVDFSQDFEEQPTPAQLKERAEQYISANNIGVPSVSISVSFVDLSQTDQYKGLALLEQCDLCDTVTVQFEALGVNATAEIVRIETDVLLERYKTIEVGSLRTNITDTIVGNNQATNEKIDQTASWLEKQVQEATDQITNGGGYIYRVYDANKNLVEIGSTDNLDLSKAKNVWRWNNGGFGFSGTGYNGPYTTAITQDGKIVADFIKVGTLSSIVMSAVSIIGSIITGASINGGIITGGTILGGTISGGKVTGTSIEGSVYRYGNEVEYIKIEDDLLFCTNGSDAMKIENGAIYIGSKGDGDNVGPVGNTGSTTSLSQSGINVACRKSPLLSWLENGTVTIGVGQIINGSGFSPIRYELTDTGEHGYCVTGNGSCNNFNFVWKVTSDSYLEFSTLYGAYGITAWSSDKNKKENIKDSTICATDLIKKIKHRAFKWKDAKNADGETIKGGEESCGYVAQEMKKIDPSFVFAVAEGTDKEALQISEPHLIPVITKAMQELMNKIEKLEARIKKLEKEVANA